MIYATITYRDPAYNNNYTLEEVEFVSTFKLIKLDGKYFWHLVIDEKIVPAISFTTKKNIGWTGHYLTIEYDNELENL